MGSGALEGDTSRSHRRYRLASDRQVLVGIGSLLALLAVAVGLAVFLIASFEGDATDVANRHVLYSTEVHEAALSAKGMANDYRGFLLSGNPEYVSEIRTRTAEARDAFDLAVSYAVNASHRDAARSARAGFERWLVAMQDIAAFRRGERAARSTRLSTPRASCVRTMSSRSPMPTSSECARASRPQPRFRPPPRGR